MGLIGVKGLEVGGAHWDQALEVGGAHWGPGSRGGWGSLQCTYIGTGSRGGWGSINIDSVWGQLMQTGLGM